MNEVCLTRRTQEFGKTKSIRERGRKIINRIYYNKIEIYYDSSCSRKL